MEVKVERISPTEVSVSVEVEQERVARAVDAAYKRLAARYTVPGFRRGKAPRLVLERMLGRETVQAEALDPLVNETFEEAVAQEGLDPLAQAKVEGEPTIEDGQPLTYAATLVVRPEAELPNVRELSITVPKPEMTDEDVDRVIHRLAEESSHLEETAQAETDSVVAAEVTTEVAGQVQEGSGETTTIDLSRADLLPGAREALEGAEVGETRQVVWNLPDDHPTHPGQEATTRFVVKRVWRRELPPVDDALAASVGVSSLEELKQLTRQRLALEMNERWRAAQFEAALDALTSQAKVELPETMVEASLDSSWQEFLDRLRRAKLSLPAYLAMAGKDEEAVKNEMRPSAEREARRALVLEALAIAEGLEPAEGEIRRAAEQLLSRRSQGKGERKLTPGQRRYVRDFLRRAKARRLLESLYAAPKANETDDAVDGVAEAAAE